MYQIVSIRAGQHDLLLGTPTSAREALQLCLSAATDHLELRITESGGNCISLDELTRRANTEVGPPA